MDKSAVKKCIISTKNGQLKDVLSTLDGKSALLTTEEAVKIVVCLCNACVDDLARTRFSPDDVSELVISCCETIGVLDNASMNSFLASMFHIVKYFITMKEYTCIINLRSDMIRILERGLEGEKTIKLARNIQKIIHNAICTNFSDITSENLSKLCLFSIEILRGFKTLIDFLKVDLLEYFTHFKYLRLELKEQRYIYTQITKLITAETAKKELLEIFLNLLNILLQNHLAENKITEARELIFNMTEAFKSIENLEDDVRNVFIIMENVILLVSSEDKYSDNIKANLPLINTTFEMIYNRKRFLLSVMPLSKFLHIILYFMLENLKTFTKEFWGGFDIESLVILNKFSRNVAISLTWMQQKCKSCEDCHLNYDFISAASICVIPMYMLKYCLSNDNKNEVEALYEEMSQSLGLACTLVQKMQEFKCSNWKTAWMEVGTLLYNFSVVLTRIKHEKAILYILYFIRKMILIEGVKSTILKGNILTSALLNLVEAYIKQKEYSKAMVICAFNIVLHPDNKESPFWQWVRIKSSEKDDEMIQNRNLVSIMEENRTILSRLYAEFTLTETEKRNLLVFELRQYKKIWPSKVSLGCAFKELLTYGDTLTITEALVSTWSDGASSLPTDLYDIVFDVAQKFETEILKNESTPKNNFLMAFLYLIQYYISYRRIQQKLHVDIEATYAKIINVESTTDKNDQCDVFSSYESLTIEVNIKIMKYLKKSLDIFKLEVNETNKNDLSERNVYLAVNNIANEYLLHCHTFNYLEAWLLAHKIAKILNDKICVIESVAYLVEKSDPNSKFIKDALVQAEGLIKQVRADKLYEEGENAVRKWIVLCNFYISRGLVCLNCGDAKAVLNLFKEAKLIYDEQKDSKQFELLRVKYDFFEWKLQLLPCSFKVDGHVNVLSKPNFLIEMITRSYKTNACSTYVLCLLFEIFCSVLHFHRWMRQPREVRCYGRDLIILAQELLMPFRSIHILSYLADADLLSKGVDDCRVKINGICDILGISKDKVNTNYLIEEKKPAIAEEISSLANTFQEMMLDFPIPKKQYYQSTSGSPDLLRDSFKIPSFIGHDDDCDCFYCSSLDYQELVLIETFLQGSLWYFQKNFGSAVEYYRGALCIYRRILNKEKSLRVKKDEILGVRLLPSVEYKFREIYCIILLGLGNCLVRTEKFMQISTELVGILKKNHYFNIYLYNEALYQQLNYLCLKSDHASKTNLRLSPTTENVGAANDTTPENKRSAVNLLPPTYTPVSITKKKVGKLLKFDLSDNEDKEVVPKKPPSSPIATHFPTTPAVSKIKVYQPTSIRTTRKKKVAGKLEFASEKKENIEVKFELPKASQELKSKTRLLTEKLKKKSAVPDIVVTQDGETENVARRTRGARKNLMSELSIEDNNDKTTSASYVQNSNNDANNKGAIKKRVTRSRKVL